MTPEQFNAWRVMPRLLVAAYSGLVYLSANWFMTLPAPTMTQSGFVATVIGAAAFVFNFYVNSGK